MGSNFTGRGKKVSCEATLTGIVSGRIQEVADFKELANGRTGIRKLQSDEKQNVVSGAIDRIDRIGL